MYSNFRNEVKVFLAQNLMRFENLELSAIQTQQLLDNKVQARLCLDFDDVTVIKNVINTLDFVEKLDFNKTKIDLNLYKKLNEMLSFNQSLYPGQLREGDHFAYIPCIEDPIKPASPQKIQEQLDILNTLENNSYKDHVSHVFCNLSKMQPFYDGNKRSTLFLCNCALQKQNFDMLIIKNDIYPDFELSLTRFYSRNDCEIFEFLKDQCFHKNKELSLKTNSNHKIFR